MEKSLIKKNNKTKSIYKYHIKTKDQKKNHGFNTILIKLQVFVQKQTLKKAQYSLLYL